MRIFHCIFFLLIVFVLQSQDTLSVDALPEMVISASRQSELKTDIPNEVDILGKKEIEALNPLTAADALESSAAVYVQRSQQGGGSPVLRGFEANRVLLVIDGVRMNNAIYRGGHLQNSITTDPSMLDRMEILHGAGAVVYGTDAIGGVVSFFTRKPKRTYTSEPIYTTNAYTRFASANQGQTVHVDFEAGFKNWASLTGVTVSRFGDVRMGSNDHKNYPNFGLRTWYVDHINGQDSIIQNSNPRKQVGSAYDQIDFLQKLILDKNNGNRHELNLQYSNSTDVPRYDRLAQLRDGLPRSSEWNYGPQKRLFAAYSWIYSNKRRFFDGFKITPAYQRIQESRITRGFDSDMRQRRVEDLDVFSINFDFFKNINAHEIRYGSELISNALQSKGTSTNILINQSEAISSRYPDGTYRTFGVYLTHRWELWNRRFILSDGVRVSGVALNAAFDPRFFDTSFGDLNQGAVSFNWNLGGVVNLGKGVRINGVLSTGFRNPNIDDAGKIFETNDGGLIIPNPNAKPEKVFYKELGINKTLAQQSSISLSVFHSSLTDVLNRRPFMFNGRDSILFQGEMFQTFSNINVGKAVVYGFSFDSKIRITDWIFRTGLSYTKGIDKIGNLPLDHIPPVYGKGQIQYAIKNIEIETGCLFNAWKRIEDYSLTGSDNPNYATPEGTPAWARLDFRLAYKVNATWRFQFKLENILDSNYRTFASGINAPGRNAVLSVFWGG